MTVQFQSARRRWAPVLWRAAQPFALGRRGRSNVYLLTGDALQWTTAGWTPNPDDQLTPLGDETWAGFLADAGCGLRIYVLGRRRSLARAEA